MRRAGLTGAPPRAAMVRAFARLAARPIPPDSRLAAAAQRVAEHEHVVAAQPGQGHPGQITGQALLLAEILAQIQLDRINAQANQGGQSRSAPARRTRADPSSRALAMITARRPSSPTGAVRCSGWPPIRNDHRYRRTAVRPTPRRRPTYVHAARRRDPTPRRGHRPTGARSGDRGTSQSRRPDRSDVRSVDPPPTRPLEPAGIP